MTELSKFIEQMTKKTSVMIIGQPRTGKSVFALELVVDGIRKNEGVICVLTNTFPQDFLEGTDIQNKDFLRIIDCYTHYVGIPGQDSSTIHRVNGPSALNDMGVKLSKSITELKDKVKRIRIIFNSLSTLLAYNDPDKIVGFLQVFIGRIKAMRGISVLIIEEGMHDPKYITAVASLTETTVELFSKDGDHFVRVVDISKREPPIKYKIVNKKLVLEE